MLNNNLKIPGKSWVLKFLKSREVVSCRWGVEGVRSVAPPSPLGGYIKGPTHDLPSVSVACFDYSCLSSPLPPPLVTLWSNI